MLITAGPTHEPIDTVRYIGNRSSGRLGVSLADEAAKRGHRVTLLLGPAAVAPSHTSVKVIRFQTTADLEALLAREFPRCDVLIQAAAIADYRVARVEAGMGSGTAPGRVGNGGGRGRGVVLDPTGKLRRQAGGLTIHLEATPDLLAGVAKARAAAGSSQTIVGFALEPRERLLASAREKLSRKAVDFIVANELETMDSPNIEAVLVSKDAEVPTGRKVSKAKFAGWLLERVGVKARDGGQ